MSVYAEVLHCGSSKHTKHGYNICAHTVRATTSENSITDCIGYRRLLRDIINQILLDAGAYGDTSSTRVKDRHHLNS